MVIAMDGQRNTILGLDGDARGFLDAVVAQELLHEVIHVHVITPLLVIRTLGSLEVLRAKASQ